MKDMLGTDVFAGDILLELGRGGGWVDGKRFYYIKLWEMPERYDGHGYAYNIDGNRYLFAWTHIESSVVMEKDSMPDGFLFSFYHGMSDLNTSLEQGYLFEIIEASDWHRRKITKEDVIEFDETGQIKLLSKKDVYENVDVLMNSKFINYEIMKKVLELFGISEYPVVNGEWGIAKMYDIQNYNAILFHVKHSGEIYR